MMSKEGKAFLVRRLIPPVRRKISSQLTEEDSLATVLHTLSQIEKKIDKLEKRVEEMSENLSSQKSIYRGGVFFSLSFVREGVRRIKKIDKCYQTLGRIPIGIIETELAVKSHFISKRLFPFFINTLVEKGYISREDDDIILKVR